MTEKTKQKIVWIDLETTGLDPSKDAVLEVAAVITSTDFEELEREKWLVKVPVEAAMQRASGRVLKMHYESGLWSDLQKGNARMVANVDRMLAELILTHCAGDERPPVLGGSSVHFDRSFMKAQLPMSERLLSHRNFDVSSLRMARDFAAPDVEWPKRGRVEHRAMEDILWSVEAATRYIADLTTLQQRKEESHGR